MKDNDRLFAMRERAEKTVTLIKQMNETFSRNPDENMIIAIMASNYDAFWEGYNWIKQDKTEKIESLIKDFASRFYASDYLSDRDHDVRTFLQDNGFKFNGCRQCGMSGNTDLSEQLPVFWDICRDCSDDSLWVCIPPQEEGIINLSPQNGHPGMSNRRITNLDFKRTYKILNTEERQSNR